MRVVLFTREKTAADVDGTWEPSDLEYLKLTVIDSLMLTS